MVSLAILLTFLCRDDEGEDHHQSAPQGIDTISISFAFVIFPFHQFCFLEILPPDLCILDLACNTIEKLQIGTLLPFGCETFYTFLFSFFIDILLEDERYRVPYFYEVTISSGSIGYTTVGLEPPLPSPKSAPD